MKTFSWTRACGLILRGQLAAAILLGAAVVISTANTASAGNMLLQIQQGASVLNTSGAPNFVSVSGVTVGDYMITFSGGTSNTPGSSFNAILNSINLTVTRITEGSAAPLMIRLLSSDYTSPEGNPLFLGSSGSATFTGLSDGSSSTFWSYFSGANSTLFGDGVQTSPVTSTAGGTLTDGAGNRAPTIMVNRPGAAFALSNLTSINLLNVGTTINTTGSTEVRGTPFGPTDIVPEPASFALLAIGGVGLAGIGWRRGRRRTK